MVPQWALPVVGVMAVVGAMGCTWWHLQSPPAAVVPRYAEERSDVVLATLVADPARRLAGEQLFGRYCTLCHGVAGVGHNGPNLRDDQWLHGGRLRDISVSIANGYPARGMAAWAGALTLEERDALLAYIVSLSSSSAP